MTAAMVLATVAVAMAADTQNYSYTGQGSPDSSTCGGNWANDTYTRVFKVYPEQNVDGSYRVQENFTKGHFVTIQGSSPESCEAGDHNLVSGGVHGSMHGFFIIKVTGGAYSPSGAADCTDATTAGVCTTADFIASAFGSSANYTVSDYWIKYTTSSSAACARKWINSATGDSGDIATICQP